MERDENNSKNDGHFIVIQQFTTTKHLKFTGNSLISSHLSSLYVLVG